TDFSACAETRRRKLRPSASEISVTSHRFGRNLRLVLFSAWLLSCPERGSLPVSSQRLVIVKLLRPRSGGCASWQGVVETFVPLRRGRRGIWRLLCPTPPFSSRHRT